MARAPVEGTVKRRLAAVTGSGEALRLHLELLTHTLTEATRRPLAPVTWWVAGDPRHVLVHQLARDHAVAVRAQQGADLGQRLAAVFASSLADADFCVVIGSDCPPLDTGYLEQACAALGAGRDLVLGPAEDGGYVLIGLRSPRPSLFEEMPWGGDDVARRTLNAATELGLDGLTLPMLWDVDRVEDLRRYRAAG